MSNIYRWTRFILKLLIVAAFISITVLEEPATAIIPTVFTAITLFLWWRPANPITNLMVDFFTFFAISIMMETHIGPFFSFLISLPVLLLILSDLEANIETGGYRHTKYKRFTTRIGTTLLLIAALALVIALLVDNTSLIINSTTAMIFFIVLIAFVMRKTPDKPVEAIPIQQRMIAGEQTTIKVILKNKSGFGGMLFLASSSEWQNVNPGAMPLNENQLNCEVSVSPTLSGPTDVKIEACVLDRWGLTQTRFEIEPVHLHIIPRARYAAWLAKRYLSETRAGLLPLISNIGALKPLYGLRLGVEYYGSQFYQPGDSLKNIDWKHSIRYDRLITKEFAEFRGQPAILLVNLTVDDAEEADKQTYNTIVAALSLAREQIPTSIAAYDGKEVKVVTPRLQPQIMVSQVMALTEQIAIGGKLTRYLNPVDIRRLLFNLNRLRYVETESSSKLANILQIEYNNMNNRAQSNSASRALALALRKAGQQSSVVVISQLNHDAEAIGFAAINCSRKGNPLLVI